MNIEELDAALADARTPAEVYQRAAELGAEVLGATAASVALLDHTSEWVEVVAAHNYPTPALAKFSRMAADADVPLAETIRSERLLVQPVDEVIAHYEGVQAADVAPDRRAIACVPLRSGDQVIGAMGFSFAFDVAEDDAVTAQVLAVAARCGAAIDRTMATGPGGPDAYRQLLDAARSRLAFVSAATRQLAKSLDRDAVLQTLTALVVPRFADWASVLLPEGDELVAATLVHKDVPVKDLTERAGRFRTSISVDTPSTQAFRKGTPILARGVDVDIEARIAAYPELGDLLARTRDRLVVPITFQERTLGVLTLGEAERSAFDDDDLAVAVELASRAGAALYNAELYAAERDVAEVLQRAVLPAELPKLAGLELGARYAPATVTARVGGDWYDAFELRDGRVGLCVGDVVGHGVEAAACMGQLRNALRVYALDGAPTSHVVGALNSFTIDTDITNYTTLVYGVFDRASGELEWTSAGHPPLVCLRSEGTEVLEAAHGTPIGIMPQEFGSSTATLHHGDCLVVYTDGLIERRNESLSDGLRRLTGALHRLRDHPLDDFVDRVVHEVGPSERPDDICALVLHRVPLTS